VTFFCKIVFSIPVRSGRRLAPADVTMHDAGKDDRSWVDDVFVGILRSRAVRSFENRVAVADIRPRSDAKAANLSGTGIGNVTPLRLGWRADTPRDA